MTNGSSGSAKSVVYSLLLSFVPIQRTRLEETGGFRDNLVIISGDVPLIGLEFIFGLVPDLFIACGFCCLENLDDTYFVRCSCSY